MRKLLLLSLVASFLATSIPAANAIYSPEIRISPESADMDKLRQFEINSNPGVAWYPHEFGFPLNCSQTQYSLGYRNAIQVDHYAIESCRRYERNMRRN